MGGEKVDPTGNDWYTQGSPPRGRGKVASRGELQQRHGITPAWAGKRQPLSGPCEAQWDHPRVGGEKPAVDFYWRIEMGSPPRGRGKVYSVCKEIAPLGITPAWAGKRRPLSGPCAAPGDHPRVGGEKPLLSKLVSTMPGSPPRGRGKGNRELT